MRILFVCTIVYLNCSTLINIRNCKTSFNFPTEVVTKNFSSTNCPVMTCKFSQHQQQKSTKKKAIYFFSIAQMPYRESLLKISISNWWRKVRKNGKFCFTTRRQVSLKDLQLKSFYFSSLLHYSEMFCQSVRVFLKYFQF